jgi:hypothetical protein
VEAGSLPQVQEEFRTETGLEFSFIFAIYEGTGGNPANSADCEAYASDLGITEFPVLADGRQGLAGITPMTQQTHPEMCALAPDMTILGCYSGHGGYSNALDDIRDHAGL